MRGTTEARSRAAWDQRQRPVRHVGTWRKLTPLRVPDNSPVGQTVKSTLTTTPEPRAPPLDGRLILDRLKLELLALRQEFGVKEPAIFDSVARGDDRPESDLDVLVTFKGPATFDRFMELKLHLKGTLRRPVDLGTPETLRPELLPAVGRDLIHVA